MKVFGIAGWSSSGKTTLITKLIPEIINRGRKVSTIKHTHHSFDIDKPGKDSFRPVRQNDFMPAVCDVPRIRNRKYIL